MDTSSENDNYQDSFLYEIDKSIESGNEQFILNAIKNYKNKINDSYILLAQNILINLLEEKIELMDL